MSYNKLSNISGHRFFSEFYFVQWLSIASFTNYSDLLIHNTGTVVHLTPTVQ